MKEILGKWVQEEGQPFAGLSFEFHEDGTFVAVYHAMSIVSSGSFEIDGQNITIHQTKHTYGLVGTFDGIFEIDDRKMKMALTEAPGGPRPKTFSFARTYIKED